MKNDIYIIFLNKIVDDLMCDLSGNELKVLLYLIRHTVGFDKKADSISISQFMYGIIKKSSGNYFDHGTGLSKNTILKAINGLIAKGIVTKIM